MSEIEFVEFVKNAVLEKATEEGIDIDTNSFEDVGYVTKDKGFVFVVRGDKLQEFDVTIQEA